MPRADPIQCPVCGWTGRLDDLKEAEGAASCPSCRQEIRYVE